MGVTIAHTIRSCRCNFWTNSFPRVTFLNRIILQGAALSESLKTTLWKCFLQVNNNKDRAVRAAPNNKRETTYICFSNTRLLQITIVEKHLIRNLRSRTSQLPYRWALPKTKRGRAWINSSNNSTRKTQCLPSPQVNWAVSPQTISFAAAHISPQTASSSRVRHQMIIPITTNNIKVIIIIKMSCNQSATLPSSKNLNLNNISS